ncbi:cbb3-type cytochrome oxidase assembly protein CcoS [Alteromonas gilva]|uniref:Cbb3-type cytochrome oxidase assembly protein CcoS n=1 Tax=Alteromonas gilva TaxID=2987522 RepID=A0ABT5L232_9ALTE|nr:cbb3-type cytochrome oxidase assembly protein CcoS [Alteromonas gilva]MDC8831104.1 cbb3-type cytochrome oxidase assembly protein CcoS [Alteromonas gilva]
MSIIYVLIPLAIILVAVALGIFFWAVRSNQFDDLERQGYSILFDDDLPEEQRRKATSSESSSTKKTDSTASHNE